MIIIEFMKDNYEHIDVNSAVTLLCLLKNNNETIYLFAGEKHFKAIKEKLNNHNINTSRIMFLEIQPIGRIIRDYEEFKKQYKTIKSIFNFAKSNNEKEIFFTYTTSFSVYFLKLFCFLNKNISVKTVIHSELEKINIKEYLSHTLLNKIQVFFYVLLFGIQNPLRFPTPKNLKYIVYGSSIKKKCGKNHTKNQRFNYCNSTSLHLGL